MNPLFYTCSTPNFQNPDGPLEPKLVIPGHSERKGRQQIPLFRVERRIPR
jgi:hypothetical protein